MGKLGLGVQGWTPGTYEAVMRAGGRVLKVMTPEVDPVARVLAAHPHTVIICREYESPEGQAAYLARKEDGGRAWAHRVLERFAAMLAYCRSVGATVCVEGLNEPPTWPDYAEQADLNNRFTLGFVEVCKAAGVRPCVLNYSVGNPPGDEATMAYIWRHLVPCLRATKAANGYLGLHEYSAPTMQSAETWHCLRYRRVYAMLPDDLQDLPLLIGECGIDGGVAGAPNADAAGWKNYASATEYQQQLRWYDSEISKDPQVVGAAIFTAGSTGMWDSFEVKDCLPVLDYIASYEDVPPPLLLPSTLVLPLRALRDIYTQLDAIWGWSHEYTVVTDPAGSALRDAVTAIKNHLAEGVEQ